MKVSGSYKDIKMYSRAIDNLKVQCKICGRKIPFLNHDDRKICDWCHNYVYKDEKTEFKYKMKGIIKNESERFQKNIKGNETRRNHK